MLGIVRWSCTHEYYGATKILFAWDNGLTWFRITKFFASARTKDEEKSRSRIVTWWEKTLREITSLVVVVLPCRPLLSLCEILFSYMYYHQHLRQLIHCLLCVILCNVEFWLLNIFLELLSICIHLLCKRNTMRLGDLL